MKKNLTKIYNLVKRAKSESRDLTDEELRSLTEEEDEKMDEKPSDDTPKDDEPSDEEPKDIYYIHRAKIAYISIKDDITVLGSVATFVHASVLSRFYCFSCFCFRYVYL